MFLTTYLYLQFLVLYLFQLTTGVKSYLNFEMTSTTSDLDILEKLSRKKIEEQIQYLTLSRMPGEFICHNTTQ